MKNNKVSINLKWVGKPTKVDNKMYNQDGVIVNTATDWQPVEGTVADIFELVAIHGYPICSVLSNGYRNKQNFISHSLLMVDIDHGLTIAELKRNSFYVLYGAGYYTTPSHTNDDPRFRVIFVLENDITDVSTMEKLYTQALTKLGGDKSCKDAARFFNGTVNCQKADLNTDKVLTDAGVAQLLAEYDAAHPTVVYASQLHDYELPCDHEKAVIVNLLSQLYWSSNGSETGYNRWLGVGFAMKSAGFSCDDWIAATHEPNRVEAQNKWKGFKPDRTNLGAVINIIKQAYGEKGLWQIRAAKEAAEQQAIADKLAALRAARRNNHVA